MSSGIGEDNRILSRGWWGVFHKLAKHAPLYVHSSEGIAKTRFLNAANLNTWQEAEAQGYITKQVDIAEHE